jgi:beta-glucosidase
MGPTQHRTARRRRMSFGAISMGLAVAVAVFSCTRLDAPSQAPDGGGSSGGGASSSASGSGSGVGVGSASGSSGGSVSSSGEMVVDGAAPDAAKMACGAATFKDPYTPGYQPDPSKAGQAQSVINSMSVAELVQQMRGTPPGTSSNANYGDIFRTTDNVNKGIKGFLFRDGPRGVNLAAQLPNGQQGYSTAFPVPAARGASFDLALEQQIGAAMGDETLASGNTLMLAPVINILRHPAWGRAQETYGEDSYLLGRLGSAYVSGVQQYVPACAKHYAANNIENGRASDNAQMDDQTLHEIYGRQYEMVIQDGGVACIMAAYNLVNGAKCTTNSELLTDMLRTTFGFQGFVLSDWWAMSPGQHAPGDPQAGPNVLNMNAAAGVNAGLDIELPWALNYGQLESLAGNGTVQQSKLAAGATRILMQKLRFNVASIPPVGLQKPTTSLDTGTGSIVNNDAHVQLAYQSALESMVLLKNDKQTLPINKANVHTISVLGASVQYSVSTLTGTQTLNFATDVRLGDMGSSRVFSDPAKSTGPAPGIATSAGGGIKVVSGSDPSLASSADFVVVVVGLTPYDEGEEYTNAGDRTSFALDAKQSNTNIQNGLIAQVAGMGKPMVVVVEAGSVIDMPWLAQVPAVVMAWYPGMDGGHALGDLLFGNAIASGPEAGTAANFSGKLPITWPKSWNDEPPFNSGATTTMSYYLGYRHFEHNGVSPLYAFGHGLSYTTFSYSNLFVPCSTVTTDGVVNVAANITNTGTVAGDETAFLFVAYPNSSVTTRQSQNYKELKGFHRTAKAIPPGQTVNVTFPLRIADLKYWDASSKSWKIETGTVQILVGPSYDNLTLKDTLTVH